MLYAVDWKIIHVPLFVHACRSIGVSNFNIHHLEELKKVRPHNLPVSKCVHAKCLHWLTDELMLSVLHIHYTWDVYYCSSISLVSEPN